MIGVNRPRKKWRVPTLICDATGDAEILKAIWPQLIELEPHGWEQMLRPPGVRIIQCVNESFSKKKVAIEVKRPTSLKRMMTDGQQDLDRRTANARRLFAAVLTKALQYGGVDVGVITYKSTEEWIKEHCFIPKWIKILHWGDVTGTNTLRHARALFVIGRPLPPAEAMTQQAEALFGTYIPQRDYVVRQKQGRIPIVTDSKGYKSIEVDVWEHPDRQAERLRRQTTEGSIYQAGERTRTGLREMDEPLDIHIWTDVPVPELGPVEPILREEIETGLDGLMLASTGWWFANTADAAQASNGLFTEVMGKCND
jgi:hypothetical protein